MKTYKFTIKGQEYEVSVDELNDGHLDVDVNGTTYQVELEQEMVTKKTPKLVRKPVVNKPGEGKVTKSSGGTIKVKAPLPGNIFKMALKSGIGSLIGFLFITFMKFVVSIWIGFYFLKEAAGFIGDKLNYF